MEITKNNRYWHKATGVEWIAVEAATHPEDDIPEKWKFGRWKEQQFTEAIFSAHEMIDQAPPIDWPTIYPDDRPSQGSQDRSWPLQ